MSTIIPKHADLFLLIFIFIDPIFCAIFHHFECYQSPQHVIYECNPEGAIFRCKLLNYKESSFGWPQDMLQRFLKKNRKFLRRNFFSGHDT